MSKVTIELDTKDPDEVRRAIALLQTALGSLANGDEDSDSDDDPRPTEAEWTIFIDNLWKRLGRNARELLKAQADFPIDQYWPSEDLADKLGVTVAQLTGKRANLGRSLKATAEDLGVDANDYDLSEYVWDEATDDRWLYRLPRAAQKAIASR